VETLQWVPARASYSKFNLIKIVPFVITWRRKILLNSRKGMPPFTKGVFLFTRSKNQKVPLFRPPISKGMRTIINGVLELGVPIKANWPKHVLMPRKLDDVLPYICFCGFTFICRGEKLLNWCGDPEWNCHISSSIGFYCEASNKRQNAFINLDWPRRAYSPLFPLKF